MSSGKTQNQSDQILTSHYIAVWKFKGANKLTSEDDPLEVIRLDNPMLVTSLTCDPSSYLFRIDNASAVAHQMLKGMLAPRKYSNLDERLAFEIGSIKEQREKDSSISIFLVIEGKTEIHVEEFRGRRDEDQFSVCFDQGYKFKVREQFDPLFEFALASTILSLDSRVDHQIEKMGDVIYFTDSNADADLGAGTQLGPEKPIYVMTMRGGAARLSVSSPINGEIAAAIHLRFSKLVADNDMHRPISLLVISLRKSIDHLQAFISAWSALEIFVNTSFKRTYESDWLEIMEGGAPVSAKPVFKRFKEIMSDKYRLADKFLIMASVLDPEAATSDSKDFRKLKKVRDDLLHGLESPRDLPIEAVQSLLIKYMTLHCDR